MFSTLEAMILGGPYLDVALASRPAQARGEQVPEKIHSTGSSVPTWNAMRIGVRVVGAVAEAGHERDGPVLGNHKTEPELSWRQ